MSQWYHKVKQVLEFSEMIVMVCYYNIGLRSFLKAFINITYP